MATASNDPSIKVIEEGLSCYICYSILREPKELDCPHIYCLQCLRNWVGKKPTIECPECRHITIVPTGGLANLKTNLRLKTMAETYAEQVEKRKGVPICPDHEGERQHFFCVTCGVTVCHNCLVFIHERPQHEIKELKVITKAQKEEMKAKMEHVQEEVKKAKDDEQKLGEMERKIQAAKEQAERDIEKQVHHVIAKVEAKGKELKAHIQTTCEQHMKILQEKQNYTKDQITRLQNVQSAMQNLVDTAVDHVYMKQHTSLVDKMEKLCVTPRKMPSPDVASLRFNPESDPVNLSWFGEAVLYGKRICGLKLITEFGSFKQAQGIAETQTGLFAVVDAADAKEVIIYRDDNGEYKRQFSLGSSADGPNGELTRPLDVAVTSDGKFLVADNGPVVKVFLPTGKYERAFSIDADRITTTPDDMIVIGSSAKGVITVHQSNGWLIRTHKDCKRIQDIASNGKQIAFTTGSKSELHVIDFVTGQALWTLDMIMPLVVCHENKSNTIFVAAGSSKKTGDAVIEQYCSTTGCLISRLASGLFNPLAMTITHDGKLAVADLKTVKVYNIQ